jgi:hypothetical protein
MTIALALAVLALTDCLLCGHRAATGTEGRLDKRAYYREAALRALGGGIVVVGAHAILVTVLVVSSSDPGTWSAFLDAGTICVWVYGAFATAIFGAFAFYFAPIGDFRVLTNVIVFGPLTLARPYVIAGGLAAAVVHVPDARVAMVAVSAGISMLSFQRIMDRRYVDRWRRVLEPGA